MVEQHLEGYGGKNAVERRLPVGCDYDQLVPCLIGVAHFALSAHRDRSRLGWRVQPMAAMLSMSKPHTANRQSASYHCALAKAQVRLRQACMHSCLDGRVSLRPQPRQRLRPTNASKYVGQVCQSVAASVQGTHKHWEHLESALVACAESCMCLRRRFLFLCSLTWKNAGRTAAGKEVCCAQSCC